MYRYIPLHQQVESKNALREITITHYDFFGNMTMQQNSNGEEIRYTYNRLNQLIKKSVPFDEEQRAEQLFYYDDNGNLLKSIDADGYMVENQYNNLNQQIATANQIDTQNKMVTQMEYDSLGNILSVVVGASSIKAQDGQK